MKSDPEKIKEYREKKRLAAAERISKIRKNFKDEKAFKARKNYLWQRRLKKLKREAPEKYKEYLEQKAQARARAKIRKALNPESYPNHPSIEEKRARDREIYRRHRESNDIFYKAQQKRNKIYSEFKKKLKEKSKVVKEKTEEEIQELKTSAENKNYKEERKKFLFLTKLIKKEYGDDILFETSDEIIEELRQLSDLDKASRLANPA